MFKSTVHINSIAQALQSLGLPKPMHPLVTVIYTNDIKTVSDFQNIKVVNNLYQIALKSSDQCGRLQYGKNVYDYDEGTLIFTAPGQVTEHEGEFDLNNQDMEGGPWYSIPI